jgi:hypothetical protein
MVKDFECRFWKRFGEEVNQLVFGINQLNLDVTMRDMKMKVMIFNTNMFGPGLEASGFD